MSRAWSVGGSLRSVEIFSQLDNDIQIDPAGISLLPLAIENPGLTPVSSGTRTEVGEALDGVVEAPAGASEEGPLCLLQSALRPPRPSTPTASSRTPLEVN